MNPINLPIPAWVTRTRKNHALEHAVLKILAKRLPERRMAGYSGTWGFWIIGNIPLEALQESVIEAHTRLNAGEWQLSVHPNCGTNTAAAGLLAGTAAWLAMQGSGSQSRPKADRLPLVIASVTLALLFAQPLGLQLQQRVTTLPRLGDHNIVEIECIRSSTPAMYRVITA